ncbi:MAG: MFS transporter [Kocuria sp.]|nr:MFS transporter [Kocuria sp.]
MTTHRNPALPFVSVVILVAAITLRPGATSVGPVLAEISTGLDLSGATAGLLTALPGFMFAAAGFLAVPMSRKLGIGVSIGVGLALVIVALFLRPFTTSVLVFVLLSALSLGGMALSNVLIPAVIQIFGRQRPGLLSAFYATGLAVGGAAPPLLAGAMLALVGGWREYLASWAWLAVVALGFWVVLLVSQWQRLSLQGMRAAAQRGDVVHPATGPLPVVHGPEAPPVDSAGRRVWHSPTVRALMVFFGVQSTNAYIQFGWLAQIYRDGGLSLGMASAMVGVIAALGIPGGFFMPLLVGRTKHLTRWITGMGVCMVVGYAGLLVAPSSLPVVWAFLLGLGSLAFPTALALVTERTRHPLVTARVSGFVQPAGYVIAGVGPLLIGIIHDWADSWTIPLALLLLSSVPLVIAGCRAACGGCIDDELRA